MFEFFENKNLVDNYFEDFSQLKWFQNALFDVFPRNEIENWLLNGLKRELGFLVKKVLIKEKEFIVCLYIRMITLWEQIKCGYPEYSHSRKTSPLCR